MNLLIVDDEPIIRVGLRTLIDWNEHGFTLQAEATDGKEALDIIHSGGIDIVVTDIRMPRMDGLELIRCARLFKADIGVLVLSCLDDFSFVKEAMKLGASDYILKPTMEPEELVAILKNMKQKIELFRQEKLQLNEWQTQLEQSRHYQLSAWTRQYLRGEAIDPRLEQELFPKGSALFSLMVTAPPSAMGWMGEIEVQDCITRIRWNDHQTLLLFSIGTALSKHEQHNVCYGKARDLETKLKQLEADICGSLGICISPVIFRLSELPAVLLIHERQAHYRFYLSRDTIISEEGILPKHDPAVLPYELRNDLLKSISSHNVDRILYTTEQIGAAIQKNKPELSRLYAYILELLGLAVGYARENGYSHLDEFEQHYVSMARIQSCTHVEELNHWLLEAMSALWGSRWGSTLETQSRNPFIRKALQFMKDHYKKNIGTVDIADYVKLSRSYLSDLYSKEMGESLIETLTRIRIEEAKKKLRSSELKVYEIAEEVGFSDPKSFAKTFKRIVGCTPKEYDMQNK